MKKKIVLLSFGIVYIMAQLTGSPLLPREPRLARGDLVGRIYEKDMITPVREAVVQLKKLPEGKIHTSSISDSEGRFRVPGIEKGVYLLGVKTSDGNYNGQTLLGLLVSSDMPARLEIFLSFQKKTAGAPLFEPFFPDPVGQVSIAAGNQAVCDGVVEIDDQPREAGPFRMEFPE